MMESTFFEYDINFLQLVLKNLQNSPFAKPIKVKQKKVLTIHNFLPQKTINFGKTPEPPTNQIENIFVFPRFANKIGYLIWKLISHKNESTNFMRLQQIHLWEGIH